MLRLIFLLLGLCYAQAALGQSDKKLILDRYGLKQIVFQEGDYIYFSTFDNPKIKYYDRIVSLRDSTIQFAELNAFVELKDIRAVHFPRPGWKAVRKSTYLVGGGFVASSIFVSRSDQFNPDEALLIGSSILAFGQVTRALKWKTFKMNRRARIRILDLSFG
ncbi:MAG: hypothetical protein AAF740_12620 [Bacteroidota bacterium]